MNFFSTSESVVAVIADHGRSTIVNVRMVILQKILRNVLFEESVEEPFLNHLSKVPTSLVDVCLQKGVKHEEIFVLGCNSQVVHARKKSYIQKYSAFNSPQ